MTALVIGASGLIGRSLCEALVKSAIPVVATRRSIPSAAPMAGVRWRILRLATFNQWDRLLRDVDTVYHLAWSTIPANANLDPAFDVSDNLVGTIRLLEAARKRAGIRIVFASSGGTVYGNVETLPVTEETPANPISAYGLAKLVAEQYIANYRTAYGLDGVSLRIGNCYGAPQRSEKGLGSITLFARAALRSEAITVFGSNKAVRDYLHVDDVASALIAAGRRRNLAGPINIGSGIGYSLADVIRVIEQVIGRKLDIHYAAARPYDVAASILDITLARRELGWSPTIGFEQGIRLVIRQLQAELQSELDVRCASRSSSTATSQTITSGPKPTREASRANLRLLGTTRSS